MARAPCCCLWMMTLMLALAAGVGSSNVLHDADLGKPEGKTGLHILVPALPVQSLFLPLKAIAQALVERGNRVTIMLENCEWSAGPVQLDCVAMRASAAFRPDPHHNMTTAEQSWPKAMLVLKHQAEEWDAFLDATASIHRDDPVDVLLFEAFTGRMGFVLAHHLDLPYARVDTSLLQMPFDHHSWLPVAMTGHPRSLSFGQRWFTFLAKLIFNLMLQLISLVQPSPSGNPNGVQEARGMRPLTSSSERLGMESLLFVTSMWGFDIPQPICPNVVPIGTLVPKDVPVPIEPELQAFLESPRCGNGAVYINVGTLLLHSDRAIAEVRRACRLLSHLCCVWRIEEEERRLGVLNSLSASDVGRFFLSAHFASPTGILQHWRTIAFVTSCGDKSMWEAVRAGVPLIGLPFFGNQENECQRLSEAGLGVCIGNDRSFSARDMAVAVLEVAENRSFSTPEAASLPSIHAPSTYLRSIFRFTTYSARHGGAAMAARVIESQMEFGLLPKPSAGRSPLSCPETVHVAHYTVEGSWSSIFWIVVIAVGLCLPQLRTFIVRTARAALRCAP